MKPCLLAVLCFSLWIQNATAQSERIDSLKQLIQKYRGVDRVDALNEYADAIFSYDYLLAKKIAHEAYQLGVQLNYNRGVAKALINEGNIESAKGNVLLSMFNFKKSLIVCERAQEIQLKGNVLTYIGQAYQDLDQLDSASLYYEQAREVLKDSLNPQYLSFLYSNLADFYRIKNNDKLRYKYLIQSWEIRKKLKGKRAFVWVGIHLAIYHTEHSDYQVSLNFLNQIQKELGRDTVLNEEISGIYKERAIVLAHLGNYKGSLDLFMMAKKFYEHNSNRFELINLFTDIGSVLADISHYEASLKYNYKALGLAEPSHNYYKVAVSYFQLAWVYFQLEQDKLAEGFCDKLLTLSKDRHYAFEEASAYNLLGLLADRHHKNELAFAYYSKALAIRQKNNYQRGVASTLLNLGLLNEKLNDYERAEQYELKSLALEEEMNHAIGICYTYQSLGALYLKMKDFKRAERYLFMGEALAKKINSRDVLKDIYKNRRDFYSLQSKFKKALHYSILYTNLKDSVFNQNLSSRISALQYDFDLDQKDKEIKILGQEKELQHQQFILQRNEIRQQWYIISVGLVIFILICIGSFVIYRFYKKVRKLNREVSEQNEEIRTQSEELKEGNEILSKLNKEISEQKEEIQAQTEELMESNHTIARVNEGLEEKIKVRTSELKEAYLELDTFFYRTSHDFRRPLTTFMGLAEVAKITVKDQSALELFLKVNETARSLDKMLMKLQSISVAGLQELIYSEVLVDHLFKIELDNFSNEINQKSIRVFTEVNLSEPFFSYPALVKFIIQNLLENAIAFCSTENPVVELKAYQQRNEVVLAVADNGEGINPAYLPRVFEMYFRANEKSKGNGLGLYIVKKMVDKLSGRIELKSEVGVGSTVQVFIPNHFHP